MSGALALTGLLVALLAAPLVLGTHVVVQRASRRVVVVWFGALVGLTMLSLVLGAIALVVLG
jgi:hypothetical protein